ncbi:hypothetical protein Mp_5g12290 [Marchantia polymorpha subsp. ruderalis]|uniref:Uncharacterized protein n=2 Tax=Marchantia polymorpha TaxID=3197 RepID=A0AAF6BHK0_MARPO|nr:hypothetical protein MARPO_0092s0077 [Marchantia polymorpha]BBN11484.1 hypothetical protein Mp_5g12290 [Marchantia polymorpha subsp. ruderalis]|eukprot:PTQ33116.1 hypothetical protein MARPO_0092s0077 [Marchantia polymorpha]
MQRGRSKKTQFSAPPRHLMHGFQLENRKSGSLLRSCTAGASIVITGKCLNGALEHGFTPQAVEGSPRNSVEARLYLKLDKAWRYGMEDSHHAAIVYFPCTSSHISKLVAGRVYGFSANFHSVPSTRSLYCQPTSPQFWPERSSQRSRL